jgi:imidazole glycerol-phosphate synthase subunit HisH
MTLLNESGMRETLDDLVINKKTPVLGVCVGMQILAKSSDEGEMPGLGWIDATVRKFPAESSNGPRRLPHMGWNDTDPVTKAGLFAGDREDWPFYFLHSYYFECANESDTVATTDYEMQFTSAVNSGNIYGVQFHPEKSHGAGIQLLSNFGEL